MGCTIRVRKKLYKQATNTHSLLRRDDDDNNDNINSDDIDALDCSLSRFF